MTAAFIGQRLKVLRDERGLDQDSIARIIGVKSHQIVSNIETGERKIKAEELLALADQLGVDLDYFTDPYRLVGEGNFSWRQSGRTVHELKEYEKTAGSWLAMFRYEAPRFGSPAPLRRPKLPLTRYSSFEDAMDAGERVGEELKLGDVPAARLADAIEQKFGILVMMVDAIEGVSGAACRLPELDAVLVNRKEVAGRRNFDLAHELFHIMTWEEMPPEYSEDSTGFGQRRNRVEQLADNFAAALLMPKRVIELLGDWQSLGIAELAARLNDVAEKLQVTAQALKWRLVALGKVSKMLIQAVGAEFLRNNGRERRKDEIPPLFSRAFLEIIGKALDAGHVSRRRAASQLGVDLRKFGDLFREHALPVPEGL